MKTSPKVLLTKIAAHFAAMDAWADADNIDDETDQINEMWRTRREVETILNVLNGPKAVDLFPEPTE